MPTPTSRRAPAADTAAIEARLKQIGGERGESFRVTLPNGDYVYVSPPVAAELKGNVPVIVTEAWQALKPAEQKAHVKSGLVRIEAQWGRASGGRVTVKVF
jgi:hypothetical protein